MPIKFVSYLRKSSDMLYIKELAGEFVDSVKTIANYRFVKVGQTKAYLGNQRHLHLNATNKCNLEDLSDMLSLAHPFDIRYKLTDHTVRKQVVEDNKYVKPIDKLFAKNAFGMTDGFSEILMFPADWSNDKICKTITSSYNKLMNSDVSKFTKNTEREDEYNKNKNEYIVPTTIAELMYKDVVKTAKRVLIIRQFPDWFIDRVCQTSEHVTYFIDNSNASIELPKHSNLELILCDSFDTKYKSDLEEYFDTMPNKFDLVIANPPYSIGGKVISEALKHCDKAVVLMPFSKYNGKDLYKRVLNCITVDNTAFEDAVISKNTLCVTTLESGYDNNMTEWSEFKAQYKTAEKYREFYVLNQRLPKTIDARANMTVPVDIKTTFMISPRVGDNGVHQTADCYDYRFNVLENLPVKEWSVNTYKGQSQWNFTPYRLNSDVAKRNLCRFWYDNPLMNTLLQNSGESSSSYNVAMPRIDWSIDRDYEHMTYEELLEIVKHDLRELGLSDEVN